MNEDQKILKGFNAGYLIAKHRPELSSQILKGLSNKEDKFVVGFLAGTKEYEREVVKPRTRNYDTRNLAQASKSTEKEKNKGMDDRDI